MNICNRLELKQSDSEPTLLSFEEFGRSTTHVFPAEAGNERHNRFAVSSKLSGVDNFNLYNHVSRHRFDSVAYSDPQ